MGIKIGNFTIMKEIIEAALGSVQSKKIAVTAIFFYVPFRWAAVFCFKTSSEISMLQTQVNFKHK